MKTFEYLSLRDQIKQKYQQIFIVDMIQGNAIFIIGVVMIYTSATWNDSTSACLAVVLGLIAIIVSIIFLKHTSSSRNTNTNESLKKLEAYKDQDLELVNEEVQAILDGEEDEEDSETNSVIENDSTSVEEEK